MSVIIECPSCERRIKLKNTPKEGQRVVCPACKRRSEVISEDPLLLVSLDGEWDSELYFEEDEDRRKKNKRQQAIRHRAKDFDY